MLRRRGCSAGRSAPRSRSRTVAVDGGKHFWVGETQTCRVLTEIVRALNPQALPLPTEY